MNRPAPHLRQSLLAGLAVTALLAAATPTSAVGPPPDRPKPGPTAADPTGPALIPRPVSQQPIPGQTFVLGRWSLIGVEASRPERKAATQVAHQLATQLRRSTGYPLPVLPLPSVPQSPGPQSPGPQSSGPKSAAQQPDRVVALRLSTDGPASLGAEGYRLRVDSSAVSVVAATPQGLFRGVTTLRQLLPAKAEAPSPQAGPWSIAGTAIADSPRYSYRGTMLDVSRHFFSVAEVKRYIDLASLYKLNKLHLHLADDQGWRVQIDSWPRLTTYGGSTEVGGTPGGYYTKADLAAIIRYAAQRYMTVVPEIDTPGHTNAALASYAELNCDGVAPPLYTGIEVGFSSLCINKAITYQFLADVFREVAEQTPGDLFHLGGDEAHSTPHEDYVAFVPRAASLVTQQGKRVMGWQEIADTDLPPGSVIQYWGTDDARSQGLARQGAAKGAKVVISPANRAYLDMKYDKNSPYGLSWAGYVSIERSYSWNPSTLIPDLPESSIAGVEAPIWSETLDEIDKVEFMAFPRLPGIAELGWSTAESLDWTTYKDRLAGQGSRWDVLSVNFYRAPEIAWR